MSSFDFKLTSQQVSKKFHFYKFTYSVKFPHLHDLDLRDLDLLEEVENVLVKSFNSLIDDARGCVGDGAQHMQVLLVNENLPGGQVTTLLVCFC